MSTRANVSVRLPEGLTGLSLCRANDAILTGSGGTAQRWSQNPLRQVGAPLRHGRDDRKVDVATAFAPDGERLLTVGSGSNVRLWNARGELVSELAHQNEVRSGSFSPDSQRAVTASDDRMVRLWDAEAGEHDTTLTYRSEVFAVAFATNNTVISGSRFGAQIWDTGLRRAIGPACSYRGDIMQTACSRDGRTAVLADWDGFGIAWTLPQPVALQPGTATAWMERETAMTLDSGGACEVLSHAEWLQRSVSATAVESEPNLKTAHTPSKFGEFLSGTE